MSASLSLAGSSERDQDRSPAEAARLRNMSPRAVAEKSVERVSHAMSEAFAAAKKAG